MRSCAPVRERGGFEKNGCPPGRYRSDGHVVLLGKTNSNGTIHTKLIIPDQTTFMQTFELLFHNVMVPIAQGLQVGDAPHQQNISFVWHHMIHTLRQRDAPDCFTPHTQGMHAPVVAGYPIPSCVVTTFSRCASCLVVLDIAIIGVMDRRACGHAVKGKIQGEIRTYTGFAFCTGKEG